MYSLDYMDVHVDNETEDGIVPWDKASQETRDFWLKDTKELLALISEEIEKVENPHPATVECADEDGVIRTYNNLTYITVEDFRHKILALLRPIKNPVGSADL